MKGCELRAFLRDGLPLANGARRKRAFLRALQGEVRRVTS
jgi:hypothetical protein